MDNPAFIAAVAGIVCLVIGLIAGWLIASRMAAGEARAARDTADNQRTLLDGVTRERDDARAGQDAERKRAGALENDATRLEERLRAADGLQERYDRVDDARRVAETALAALRSEAGERDRNFDARMKEREAHFVKEIARLADAEDKLQAKFTEIGEKLLTGAQAKFAEGAQGNLAALNKETLSAFEKHTAPIGKTLETYRLRVEELEKARTDDFAKLGGVINQVREGQDRVLQGADRIATTLRGATKARGDWGELQLENLLESCGLTNNTDFRREVNVKDGEGDNLRPDAIINIPGQRKLVVDVKNVFNTYARANESDTEEERRELLRAHAREVRGHIDALSNKRYQDHVDGSADFVVMFVPGEHVLYAALTEDAGLLDYALQRRVVLSSPLNFMSIALTVATVWRQAGAAADAKEIVSLGKDIYDRLAKLGSLLSTVGRNLATTNKSFNAAVASFEGRLVPAGRKFEELSVDTTAASIDGPQPLEIEPRALSFTQTTGDDSAQIGKVTSS